MPGRAKTIVCKRTWPESDTFVWLPVASGTACRLLGRLVRAAHGRGAWATYLWRRQWVSAGRCEPGQEEGRDHLLGGSGAHGLPLMGVGDQVRGYMAPDTAVALVEPAAHTKADRRPLGDMTTSGHVGPLLGLGHAWAQA